MAVTSRCPRRWPEFTADPRVTAKSQGRNPATIGVGGPSLRRWLRGQPMKRSSVRQSSPPRGAARERITFNQRSSEHKVDSPPSLLSIANARMVVLHGFLYSPSVIPASRKRQHSSAGEQPADDSAVRSLSKKRKFAHPTCPPPQFWDGLSKLLLTPNALRELNRRNTQRQRRRAENPQPPIVPRRSRRLRALRISAERGESLQRVDQGLVQCSSPCLKRLKKFATHGGPDLSDLRGVRTLVARWAHD